uniref:Eukaryotic translation initiation factor 4 gamma 1-like n=1 Tax=Sinocyclocheilus grahami TaxID=75366 RepID=A0A672MV99_SINGR
MVPAGAYYPTQPQFTPPVAPATVILNPAPQQQQAPPPPPPQAPPRRERKQIRIRDPNQGGRDITEEIMSGGRSGSTPTSPQVMNTHLNTSTLTSVQMTCCHFLSCCLVLKPTPPEPEATPPVKAEPESAPPPAEELEETWEEKEDKLDAENIKPEKQWKPLNPEEKKKYDREFLLGFRFINASMHKPEGLPQISDVVLDKANKAPLRQLDLSRLPGMNCGPDFTPSFANLGRPSAGGRGPPSGLSGPRRSGQGQRGKEPRKIIASVSLTEDVQLNKAEKAWKPMGKRSGRADEDEPEFLKTQELFKRVRSVLNKLTPQMFQPLMKQVTELTIDTEERLKGVIDLIFEKAISEPNFSVAYANMCRCLMGLKVPTSDNPGVTVNFRKLLLNRCQKEFEKDKDDDETFEKKQKELDAATEEEKQRLKEDLEDTKDKARRRSLGNIKFIGELFKLKMLTETIMHDCIVKLLKNHDLESLECLCRLLSTIGKDLDFEKAKVTLVHYTTSHAATIAGVCYIIVHSPGALDFSSQLLAPGGKGSWGSWGKGSSGGSGAKPGDSSECVTPVIVLISITSFCHCNIIEHYLFLFLCHADGTKHTLMIFLTGFVVCVFNFLAVKRETVPTPPPASSKPALTEDELEKKSTAIIEEYLHINDMKEALQCVCELRCSSLLSVFVRTGIESTLERSTIAREHMGLLFHQLVKTQTMSTQQYYKGLLEVLEVAEDMAIDIPHIWLYLAELISPMLHEGGIPMGPLFREVSKPLVPLGKAGVLLVEILKLLCKAMSHKKVGAMWRDAALSWKDFLPEDEDANKFVTEEGVEFTLGGECVRKSSKVTLSPEDISRELERLLQEKADNQRIFDWVEANLDEQQTASNTFVRPLMTAVCQSAIICENPYKVDTKEMTQRAKLLQRYIKDEQKELQALYALQSLMMQMEQPPNLLRMFFDVLYDEDVIKEDGFYRWESSKDPAEQQGKGVALKSVTAFFTWLREAEDESDNS